MSEYRRATAEELAEVGVVLNKDKYMKHTNFAKSYYPPEAYTMTLVVHSQRMTMDYNMYLFMIRMVMNFLLLKRLLGNVERVGRTLKFRILV
jgi:hypothetical protein